MTKGLISLVVTVAISALVWVAVQTWYEDRRKRLASLAVSQPAGPGPLQGDVA